MQILNSWLSADEDHLFLEEGFSCKADLETVNRNFVDCILLGEELLAGKEEMTDEDFGAAIKHWIE